VQWWKKIFQAEWMSSDIKPKGEMKKVIQRKTRAKIKAKYTKEFREAICAHKGTRG
jgi:hypothetical protein